MELADPTKAPRVIGAYRRACEEAGSRPARWKATLVDDNYAKNVHDPAEVGRLGAQISDTKWKLMAAVSSDPAVHVRRMKAMRALRATVVAVMNVSGADARAALRTYGTEVLPNFGNDTARPDCTPARCSPRGRGAPHISIEFYGRARETVGVN
jgi:hypothetical protein